MKVKVICNNTIKNIYANYNDRLLDVLLQNNIKIATDCGGRGKCLKCKVKLISGNINTKSIDSLGNILACESFIVEDITIEIPNNNLYYDYTKIVNNGYIEKTDLFGVAFDLGTTTLAFSLIDITRNVKVEQFSVINKQSQFGADVISRISACNDGNLQNLHNIIIAQLTNALEYFIKKYNITIEKIVVSGNTTMLHIFRNISPQSIGVAPFLPVFLDSIIESGKKLNLPCNSVYILPSFSAYIGADITSGVYHLNLQNDEILIDLGTNGEIIYKNNGKYYATSTAVGPCLEGATIDCGMGGVSGAISKAKIENKKIVTSTINNKKAKGICGAGLIDIISCLLKLDKIDSTGYINSTDDKLQIIDKIYLSQEDVRKFQLAKSAICSGIKVLLSETNYDIKNLSKVYIAGGIGYHIDIKNAIFTGILPKELIGKVEVCGNSSLLGAEDCIVDKNAIEIMQHISKNCTIIDLNDSSEFAESYIEGMLF